MTRDKKSEPTLPAGELNFVTDSEKQNSARSKVFLIPPSSVSFTRLILHSQQTIWNVFSSQVVLEFPEIIFSSMRRRAQGGLERNLSVFWGPRRCLVRGGFTRTTFKCPGEMVWMGTNQVRFWLLFSPPLKHFVFRARYCIPVGFRRPYICFLATKDAYK